MYQVLYRKYRPKSFDDVYGQPHITSTLLNEIRNNRLAHAYLFTGTRGTGKTTCAKILAKAVNCLNPVDGNPCGECEICKAIDAGALPDVDEIDAASNNGVDNIRNLRDATNYTPAVAKYRVYIIDEVHMLSDSAYNALLKTLEEPPEYIIFILATTEIHKVPATILSRCQRFDFHRIPLCDITSRLKQVAKAENIDIEDEAIDIIAKSADGAMRDALSLLDRCASGGGKITADSCVQTIGASGNEYLFELTDAIFKKTSTDVLMIIDRLYNDSKDMTRLCEESVKHFRDLLFVKMLKSPEKILNTTSQEIKALMNCADGISKSDLIRATEIMQKAQQNIKSGANPRIEVEIAMLKIADVSLDFSARAINKRIDALESNKPTKTAYKPENTTIEAEKTAISASENAAFNYQHSEVPDINEVNLTENDDIKKTPEEQPAKHSGEIDAKKWPEIVQVIKKSSQLLGAQLADSRAIIKNDYLLIDCDNQQFRDTLRDDANMRNIVKSAIFTVLGVHYKIGPYTAENNSNKESKNNLDNLLSDLSDNDIPIKYN